MDVKPENLPDYVRSLYRISPDRRFLYAAAELSRLTSRAPRSGSMSLRFEESRWRITLDGSDLGSLPDLPSFADARAFLASRARPAKVPGPSDGSPPVVATGGDALDNGQPAEVLRSLAGLEAAWTKSPGDPAVAEAGLHGLLWLALQTYDDLELSDPILGKALALLAIADAGRPGRLVREECLLARLLGYEDEAMTLARKLPVGDPVRLFATRDLAGLAAIAARPHPDRRAEYLYLLLFVGNWPRDEPWLQALGKTSWAQTPDGPGLRLILALDPFTLRTEPAQRMERRLLADLSLVSNPPGGTEETPPESRCSAFERAVEKEASRLDGAILDRSIVRAFYRANFYSSIYSQARYYFDQFGSTDYAEGFAGTMVDPPAGTAAELKDWILHRVRLRRSSDAVRPVAEDLSRLTHIGTNPLARIAYSVRITQGETRHELSRVPGSAFFAHRDSRPSSLDAVAQFALYALFDLPVAEKYLRSAVKRAPHSLGQDLPWALGMLGDVPGLHAIARDKTWPRGIRSSAIQQIAGRENTETKVLVEEFRELIREEPTESGALLDAVHVLERRHEADMAMQWIDVWLKRNTERDLDWAAVASTKSWLLRIRGKPSEAWAIAEPAAQSGKSMCLEEAALVLLDLGRLDDALAMAKDVLGRYGHPGYVAFVARFLWMTHRDEEAGHLLTDSARRLSSGDWGGSVAFSFQEAFKKTDDARADAAFAHMAVPSVPTLDLIRFVETLTAGDRAALALKLCDRLKGRGPPGWVAVATYHAARKARGPEQAREWLRANATPADLDVLGKQAMIDRDWDLLWDLPDPQDPTKNDILHMIRAASLQYPIADQETRKSALLRYFEGRPKEDFVLYSLFLLGRVDRTALFPRIKDTTYVSSIGWLLGLTSAHDGRFEEANDWFQVCFEAGADVPPRYWSQITLSKWVADGGTLADLARRKVY